MLERERNKVAPTRPAAEAGSEGAKARHRQGRIAHWDSVARRYPSGSAGGRAYRRRLAQVYRWLVPPGGRVLDVGCGHGDLLAALEPAEGVGVDLSPGMLRVARARYPGLTFVEADAHALPAIGRPFDAIVLSDVVNDLWDVQAVLEGLQEHATPRTRVIVNSYSRLWELPLAVAASLRLAQPNPPQSWLAPPDVANLLVLAGFEVIRQWQEVLLPLPIPVVAPLCNRVLVRIWPLRHLALANFTVARPAPARRREAPRVSVVVAARNEAGNIDAVVERTPEMGAGTELVFVEGGSTDDTWEAIERAVETHPERPIVALRQPGKGKGDAVRCGFAAAAGDLLMILDADLTVPPEDLPRFYEVAVSGKGELVNGVRLVYPMEERAMRFANLMGNKFFSVAFSWLLGQSVKDTLCGTKVLWREDYQRIVANRSYFGEFDPFGDFDLLFGAAKLQLRIVDVPVRYRERTYGSTNISRWRHGWLLLRMVAFAAARVKFI